MERDEDMHYTTIDVTQQQPHLVPEAEPSHASEIAVPAVADVPRWPAITDPANPGGTERELA